ncbi:Hsp20/alpha crystallin family protein [Streptomyces sp. NPDC001982]|uniref:Hsp20/alpha crystallin family protein n=1 Tax=Streptomyces sp. NPDC001982 TaxID=3154405 RepID=UPI00332B868B
MKRFLESAAPSWTEPMIWAPLADLSETDEAYEVECELPGIKREDIDVEVSQRELHITGELKEREREGVLRHTTRLTGRFEYRALLPTDVKAEDVHAGLANGILTVTVPKAHGQSHAAHLRGCQPEEPWDSPSSLNDGCLVCDLAPHGTDGTGGRPPAADDGCGDLQGDCGEVRDPADQHRCQTGRIATPMRTETAAKRVHARDDRDQRARQPGAARAFAGSGGTAPDRFRAGAWPFGLTASVGARFRPAGPG